MSQSPTSGSDDHLSPVWFHFLRMRWRNNSPSQFHRSQVGLSFSCNVCLLLIGNDDCLNNTTEQSLYTMAIANVSQKKYHTWCSSSMKLLDERLITCNNVPTTHMAWPGSRRRICVQMYNIRSCRKMICDQTYC